MKSPELYTPNSSKGITLFEIIITIAIFTLLTGLSSPSIINFYNDRQFDTYFKSIVQSLRRVQLKSMLGEEESSFGVYFGNDSYTLFKGDSYSSRDLAFDEVFELPANFLISGITEIIFSKIKGLPSNVGDIVLTLGERLGTITINEIGMIDY